MAEKAQSKYLDKFKEIEQFSKNFWEKNHINKTAIDYSKKKCVVLDFFPYPSGIGLHIGHTLGYIATDVYARFKRLTGHNVLYAMGYDAFGLPAEQFAIEHGIAPDITTKNNIANISKQLDSLGLMHDKDRTFNTTDTEYYKWTQWIFLQLYNSYYDEKEQKAKPIRALEEKFRSELQNSAFKDTKNVESIIHKMLKHHRLAYLDEVDVNWCPKLGTVLSDEEVINGRSERGDHPVVKKKLQQWVMRITAYGKRLVDNLEHLNWPKSVKEMQRNWIGISNGHEISFDVEDVNGQAIGYTLTVFTTRLETLAGVTFCAVSIEHDDIALFMQHAKKNQTIDLTKLTEYSKTDDFAVQTNLYICNPITNQLAPIFITNYVVAYGCKAVMGVPAHDSRDFKIALEKKLLINVIVQPDENFLNFHKISEIEYLNNVRAYEPYTEKNILINGLSISEQIKQFETAYEKKTNGCVIRKKTNMRLRDWIFSRQRYWGEPFPIVFDELGQAFALEENTLPLELPILEYFSPEFDSEHIVKPLDRAIANTSNKQLWKNVQFIKLDTHTARIISPTSHSEIEIDGKKYKVHNGNRETNTMPNWAGSCWYYIRYMDPVNSEHFVSAEAQKYWSIWHCKTIGNEDKSLNIDSSDERTPVGAIDLYLGGAEHAVLHLLYARFWYMVLHDLGYTDCIEPFDRLFNQGMILGASYKNESGKYFAPNDVTHKDGKHYSKKTNEELIETIGKIGKRYKNGIDPREICDLYSVDALRLYMMYLGPLDQSKPWDQSAIKGMSRFLEKIWTLKIEQTKSDNLLYKDFNKTIKKIAHDFEALKFNTAIAAMIILVNKIHNELDTCVDENLYKKILVTLAPLAPHTCEYLFNQHFSNQGSIFNQTWPETSAATTKVQTINVVFTVNGKRKTIETFSSSISESDLEAFVAHFANANNLSPKKFVVIKNDDGLVKLVNIVI